MKNSKASTHRSLPAEAQKRIFGTAEATKVTAETLLEEASRMYHVFHIHVQQGSYPNSRTVLNPWHKLMPEKLILLDDYSVISETIAATVAKINGIDVETALAGSSKATIDKVSKSLVHVGANVLVPAVAGGKTVVNL